NSGLAVARLTEARQVIRQVRPDSDLEAHIDYELAQALEQTGNLSEAEHIYIECLKVKRNFADAAIHLSLLLVKKGQPTEALRRAREAVEPNPADPRAHMVLAVM